MPLDHLPKALLHHTWLPDRASQHTHLIGNAVDRQDEALFDAWRGGTHARREKVEVWLLFGSWLDERLLHQLFVDHSFLVLAGLLLLLGLGGCACRGQEVARDEGEDEGP